MQVNSAHMQSLPFSSELDITMMFFIIITCHLFITQVLKYLLDVRIDSNFMFYLNVILFFMIISNVFRMITINGLQYTVHKIYIYCSLIYVLVLFILFFGFREVLFFNFSKEFQRLNSHLSVIFNDIYNDEPINLNPEVFLMISILISGLFIFILLPSIARFGENYVKTIGQYYILEEKEQKTNVFNEKTSENPEEITESLKKSKKTSDQQEKIRWILKLFNLRLILNLLILFFWIKPMMLPWISFIGSEETIFTMRILLSLSYTAILAYAFKYEIEMHFAKIYETIKTLLTDFGNENLKKVQFRVSNLVQTSLMVSYIIVSKFIIPLIILYIIIYKSNFGNGKYGQSGNMLVFRDYRKFLSNPNLNLTSNQRHDVIVYASDWNCMVTRKFYEISWLTFNCPLTQKIEIKTVGLGHGVFKTKDEKIEGDFMKVMKEILRKINLYGLIPEEFHLNVLSFWLFNYFLANYFLSVFYIIFLRHSSNI